MKSFVISVVLIVFSLSVFAQSSNLIIFSDQGENFFLVINGVKQNTNPEKNVKVTGLNADVYSIKIMFADESIGYLDKNIYFPVHGNEYTYVIKKNRKGDYKLRFMGDTPVVQVSETQPLQTVVVYSSRPSTTQTISHTQSVTTTTTTTNTTNLGNPAGNISTGISINEQGSDVNVNLNVNTGESQQSTHTCTHSTTTVNNKYQAEGVEEIHDPSQYLPGYHGLTNCEVPMSIPDFEQAKNSVMSKTFEDSKLSIAKQIVKSNCLLSAQIKELALLLDYEDSKLDLAKFAYPYVFDISNYYRVTGAFNYESTIYELNKFIDQQK